MEESVRVLDSAVDAARADARAVDILLQVVESMTSADGVGSALNRLAQLALRATGADRCAIFVRDPLARLRLAPAAGASSLGDQDALRERFFSMEPIDIESSPHRFGALWDPAGVVTIEDAEGSPLIPDNWKRPWASKSLAFAPLRASGEAIGIVAVDYVEHRHEFGREEVNLLEAIANAAGVALRGARLVEQLQRAIEIERRLSECTSSLLSGGSLHELLDAIATRFVSLLPDTSCSIFLRTPDQRSLWQVAHQGATPSQPEIVIEQLPAQEVQQIIAAWEVNPRLPLVIPDTSVYPGWKKLIPEDIRTGMLIPLSVRDEIMGIIAVGRGAVAFSEEELRVATAFADQAGLALNQARLTEELQVRLRLIEALVGLSDAVVNTSDLRSALSTLNRGVCASVGVECTRVCFRDESLAKLLGVPVATGEERAAIRAWRASKSSEPIEVDGALGFPVPLEHRAAGVLWVRPVVLDRMKTDLMRAIAVGLGEVAYKAKLRRTSDLRSQELAIASERERIARDLHDTVGQTLYGIGLKLQDVLFEVDDPILRDRLAGLRALAGEGLADVRSAVYALSFLYVREHGLVPSLRALTREFTQSTGVPAELRVKGTLPNLQKETESALFRAAHEALTNVERHARATGVVISLSATQDDVVLLVRDDGVGLGQREVNDWRSHAHFGMRSMARSLELVGGHLKVDEAQPRGLLVRAAVPVAVHEALSS